MVSRVNKKSEIKFGQFQILGKMWDTNKEWEFWSIISIYITILTFKSVCLCIRCLFIKHHCFISCYIQLFQTSHLSVPLYFTLPIPAIVHKLTLIKVVSYVLRLKTAHSWSPSVRKGKARPRTAIFFWPFVWKSKSKTICSTCTKAQVTQMVFEFWLQNK